MSPAISKRVGPPSGSSISRLSQSRVFSISASSMRRTGILSRLYAINNIMRKAYLTRGEWAVVARRIRSKECRMSCISTLAKRADSAGVSLFRRVPQWIFKTSLLSLSLALFIGAAAAQPPSWPIANGRRPQPTQQQIDSREDNAARQRYRGVQSEVDRLYDEIMRASSPHGREPFVEAIRSRSNP